MLNLSLSAYSLLAACACQVTRGGGKDFNYFVAYYLVCYSQSTVFVGLFALLCFEWWFWVMTRLGWFGFLEIGSLVWCLLVGEMGERAG